jgi:hypothetical protein
LIEEHFLKALADFKQFNLVEPENFMGLIGLGDALKALKKFGDAANFYS